jgi:hypothetical protein
MGLPMAEPMLIWDLVRDRRHRCQFPDAPYSRPHAGGARQGGCRAAAQGRGCFSSQLPKFAFACGPCPGGSIRRAPAMMIRRSSMRLRLDVPRASLPIPLSAKPRTTFGRRQSSLAPLSVSEPSGNDFANHFAPAGVVKLLAGSVKGFTHRRSCLRPKRTLFQRGIDWHGPYPQKVGAETWIRVSGTVKRGSGLSTANYRRAYALSASFC